MLKVNLSQGSLPTDVLSALQHRTLNAPSLPGLTAFVCREATAAFTPFTPLFLSSGILIIDIRFARSTLRRLPPDQAIVATVSETLLARNPDALRKSEVDSLLTDVARKVLYQPLSLCELL